MKTLGKAITALALLAAWATGASAETKRTTTTQNGGTGPYKAVICEESTLPTHTIYRPRDMKAAVEKGGKLPVLVWGNGACSNSNWGNRDMLNEIASRGYICVAIGPFQMNDGDPTPGGTDLKAAIDWVMKQPTTANSEYKDYIDTQKIGAAGHSCGGAQAMSTTTDKRVTTIIMCNSGMGAGTSMGGASPENLKTIHGPILYLLGGPDDIAYGNGMYDYDHITVNQPVCLFNKDIGHGGSFWGSKGGDYGQIIPDWLDWVFKGKRENIKIFRDNVKPSAYSSWEMKSKNMPVYLTESGSKALNALNLLHTSFTLPTTTDPNESVVWELEESIPGYVHLSSRALVIDQFPEGDTPITVGKLVGDVTYNGKTTRISHWITIAPKDDTYGVVFSYVDTKTNLPALAYARHSTKKLTYTLLKAQTELFDAEEVLPLNQAVGEAHIYRDRLGEGAFWMTCNDAAPSAENTHAFSLLRSKDLHAWEAHTIDLWDGRAAFLDPDKGGVYSTDERYKKIIKTTAPRLANINPKDKQDTLPNLMTCIIRSTNSTEKSARIFYAYANADFTGMTQPRVLYDAGVDVLDAVLEFNPYDSIYHMLYITKKGNEPAMLNHASSKRLLRGLWDESKTVLAEVENPTGIVLYRAPNKALYNIYTTNANGVFTHWQTDADFSTLTKLTEYTRPKGLPGEAAFVTEDEYRAIAEWATAIPEIDSPSSNSARRYSPTGIPVDNSYKGVVIEDGKKKVVK